VRTLAEPFATSPEPDSRASVTRAGALLAALFLSALALRPQLVGAGPLIPEIGDDLGLSHAVAGLLATIPVLCMGVFALPAGLVAARLGTRLSITLCLGGIAAIGLLRAAAPGAPLVLALTLPIGIGMGIAGALMPVAIKERFSHRPAFASGVYATGINLGAALSSGVAVPAAAAFGGWRGALALFSGVTVLTCAGWLVLTRGDRGPRPGRFAVRPPRLPWRRPVVWLLLLYFALQSIVYYGLVSWMADAFQERGWSPGAAGALLAVMTFTSLPAGLVVPWLADRGGSRRQWLLAVSALLTLATIGIAAVPDGGYAWAVLAGIGVGALFPLILTMPLDVADDPAEVGAVAAIMLGGGYGIAALGPIALGAVRDATGSFDAPLWVLVGVGVAMLLACIPLSPTRLRPA
jgi:CP family cyanate transporter-like MFS transporter